MEKIEATEQAQRAQMFTNGDDPSSVIPFFSSRSSPTALDQRKVFPIYSVPPASMGQPIVSAEKDRLTKMKQRKEAKKERAEKKVKTVITNGDQESYNIDNVLQELGEAEPGKKSNNKGKKAKVERKRSKNKKETFVQNDTKEAPSSGTGEEDEDEEMKDFKNSTNNATTKMSEFLSATSSTTVIAGVSSINLTRQTSRSTEDLFTPVIKKQKWKNKKVSSLITKDDSGHTYSSSSSASSTTSSSAMVTASGNEKTRPYNLRRKSALRPSQSFDTMKSTTSSVVSDGDTMEAAATINTNVTTSTKDQLDLASDFPPLLSSIVDRGSGPEPPKWVTKNDSQNITSTSSSSSSGFFPDSGSSSSAVIDASDDSNKNQQIGPPPDVTVGANCQQCTAGLPDVAAQAPYFMNTANSSSGVSSNAGDLTPPQTSVSEQSFFTLEEDHNETTSTPTKHSEKDTNPAVVMLTNIANPNNKNATTADDEQSASVEFGFDVNVLDFIGNSELNDDDDAIISFVANNTNHKSSVLDSPESGIGSMMSNPDSSCVAATSAGVIKTSTCPPQEPPINDAVNIPNYAQVVQFITKQWKQVQKELKQGLVHQF